MHQQVGLRKEMIAATILSIGLIFSEFSCAASPGAPMYNCVTPAGGTTLRFDKGAPFDPRCSLFSGSSLDEVANTNCSDTKCTIKITKRQEGFVVHGTMNGNSIRLLVDTGATSTALSPVLARVVGLDYETNSNRVRLRTAGGDADAVLVKGVQIGIGNLSPISVPVLVTANMTDSFALLGRDFLKHVSVVIKGNVMELTVKK